MRTFNNLTLKDETKVFTEAICVKGNLSLENSVLIVCGNLIIYGNLETDCSEIIVSEILSIKGCYSTLSNIGTDISVGALEVSDTTLEDASFYIEDGDLFVATTLNSDVSISTNGEITVLDSLKSSSNITCHYLFVTGYIDVFTINATFDIYCLSSINADNIFARDLYVEDTLICNKLHISSKLHAENGINNCSTITVGN